MIFNITFCQKCKKVLFHLEGFFGKILKKVPKKFIGILNNGAGRFLGRSTVSL